MDMKDLAAILAAVTWPITLLAVVFYFRGPLRLLVTRLADSLKVKVLRFKLFGIEAELTLEEATSTLDEMLREIVETMNELSSEEIDLFQAIDGAEGRLTVLDLLPDFKRDNERHLQLRKLRDRKLVRPIEGGNWQPNKHPVVTRFGHLVQALHLHPKHVTKSLQAVTEGVKTSQT